MHEVVERLRRRGFDAHAFPSADDAALYLLSVIDETATVGIGGSMTVQRMGLSERLRERGHTVYWHWDVLGDEREVMREAASRADVYLSSANAITRDGVICNTDGGGNRLAATVYSAKEVFFLIGRNKIVADIPAAIWRIKNVATPQNARRLNTINPCAKTGKCENCLSPQVMCGATLLMERPTGGRTIHVLMIDEELGY